MFQAFVSGFWAEPGVVIPLVVQDMTGQLVAGVEIVGTINNGAGMTSALGNRVQMYRGDSRTVEITVTADGSAVDLSTVAAYVMTVKKNADDPTATITVTGTIANAPGTDGVIEFLLVPADTASLAGGAYVYDVQLTMETGDVYTVAKDQFIILDDVTR